MQSAIIAVPSFTDFSSTVYDNSPTTGLWSTLGLGFGLGWVRIRIKVSVIVRVVVRVMVRVMVMPRVRVS